MPDVAKSLGMSEDDLKAKLQSGASLSDIAKQQGVSQDQLTQTIENSLKMQNPNASDGSLAAVAIRIAGHHGGHHHHGGGGGVQGADPASSTNALNEVAGVLKMSSTDLVSELQSGTPLSDIGQAQGVSATDLANILGKGLVADVKA